ncbi:hypothetical protein MBT84_06650 [Streptomyces sp. MBT84]|nr:hypothetical protein [Streptomyces sp. MBT84]
MRTSAGAPPDKAPPGVTTLRLHRSGDDSEGSEDLPRRVRQASLAPQLRKQSEQEPTTGPRGPVRDDERTPELVRDRMAAYREGWVRGGGRAAGRAAGHVGDSSEGDPA